MADTDISPSVLKENLKEAKPERVRDWIRKGDAEFIRQLLDAATPNWNLYGSEEKLNLLLRCLDSEDIIKVLEAATGQQIEALFFEASHANKKAMLRSMIKLQKESPLRAAPIYDKLGLHAKAAGLRGEKYQPPIEGKTAETTVSAKNGKPLAFVRMM